MKKFFIVLLVITLFAFLFFFYYFKNNMEPLSQSKELITFSVGRGDSLTVITGKLYEQGLIKNELIFKLYGRYEKLDSKLKEGEYKLSPSLNVKQIYSLLIEGRQELVSVTIPEGYTARKISKILEDKGVVKADDFLNAIKSEKILQYYNIPFKSAEGFLYPDTYSFQEDYPAILVVESFIKNFYKNLKEIYPSYNKLTSEQLGEKVILASIVEREYKSVTEVKTIASVFYNRLNINMMLQSCATVMYVLTEELGQAHRDRLYFEDLEVVSPYNTYLNLGLPPGAISNPGYNALDAAFHPDSTDYIFFVVRDRVKGLHRFSSKYSDHEAARLDYLSGFESKK